MCVSVHEGVPGGVRPEGGWDLLRPAGDMKRWGVTRSKAGMGTGNPRGAGKHGVKGLAVQG